MLASVVAEKVRNTLVNVEAEPSADMLADSVEKAGSETLGDKPRDVHYRAMVDTLADNLPVAKAEMHCHKLGDVDAPVLVAMLADTLTKAKQERVYQLSKLPPHLGCHPAYRPVCRPKNSLMCSQVFRLRPLRKFLPTCPLVPRPSYHLVC